MAQIDQIKAHFASGRRALINATNATTAADRQAYATLARAEFECCHFMWGWPDTQTGYGPLP
jgi:predicted kinase